MYNASVLYWQFCRPFLKPNYRQYLARSLHQVVKALDDIEDTDYEWRAQLMMSVLQYSHTDLSSVQFRSVQDGIEGLGESPALHSPHLS